MLRALALSLLAASAAAQTPGPRVDPAPFRWLPAARTTGFPFGYATRTRVRLLQVHDGLAGTARTISAVALRRSAASTGAVAAFRAEVALRLSTAATTAATIAPRFSTNHGADVKLVTPRRTVSFPATQGPYTGPAPFAYPIPATTPFAFAGRGPLCVELEVASHSNRTAMTFDLFEAGRTHAGAFGTGCAGTKLAVSVAGGKATHVASGLPAGAPVVLMLGVAFDSFLGRPLPLDLTPLGGTGCALRIAPLADTTAFASSTGTYRVELSLGNAPAGLFYGAQLAVVKPGLNRLGVALTDANVVVPRTARSAGRVWSEDLTAASGLAQPVWASVLEVR